MGGWIPGVTKSKAHVTGYMGFLALCARKGVMNWVCAWLENSCASTCLPLFNEEIGINVCWLRENGEMACICMGCWIVHSQLNVCSVRVERTCVNL